MAKVQSLEKNLKDRLGSDTTFPIAGNFAPISGLDLLLQDIQQLLLTTPGERVYRPDFGCTLRQQIWENLEETELEGAASIRSALDTFEPRVEVIDVSSSRNDNTGLIIFNITFFVKDIDTAINLVFPFRAGVELSFR